MAGYATDTETLTLVVALPDGTAVQVLGENDGVNGYEWSAIHVKGDTPDPLPVEVHHERLIDGIEPDTCDCDHGVLWPMASDCDDSHPYVERCDDCRTHADDLVAADSLAARIDGLVIFHMLYDNTELRRWQPAVYPRPS